ncbi:MAG: hypothetical protein JWN63_3420 [Candidatus Acidoferrum typicum]|nr:hypothetical protein [Candidatus Acidoferrum typicum]
MSEGAAHTIQRLQRELMLEKVQCQHWQAEAAKARVALVTCGNFLHNLNSAGSHLGFNAACRAVEVGLNVDSVSRCRQLETPAQHRPSDNGDPR